MYLINEIQYNVVDIEEREVDICLVFGETHRKIGSLFLHAVCYEDIHPDMRGCLKTINSASPRGL